MRTCNTCAVKYPDALEYCPKDGQRLAPPPGDTVQMYDPLIGTTIDGRYAVEALLGEGGMGFVYAARHVHIDKRVALKILRKEAAADQASAQRFIDEARAASKIGHQNIVDITDFGVLEDGHAYFVMEYLDGPTLAKIIATDHQIAPARAIGIATQIARGLHAAHAKGIIHRDLKPDNIFVVQREADRMTGSVDLIKIVDFGIAKDLAANKKLTQVGMVLGTPEYISPEQATGSPSDHRVDVYALGCILYEMLTGTVPFRNDTAPKTLVAHVIEAPMTISARRPDLKTPPALEAVVMRMLEKKPGDRYADMRLFMNALDELADKIPAAGARGSDEAFAETASAQPLRQPKAPIAATLPPFADAPRPETMPPVVRHERTGWTSELGTELIPRKAKRATWALVVGAGLGIIAVAIFLLTQTHASTIMASSSNVAAEKVRAATPPEPKATAPAIVAAADAPIAKQVGLVVVSTPASARLAIDGVSVGKTPYKGGIIAGSHHLVVQLDGYNDRAVDVDLVDDQNIELTLTHSQRGGKKTHSPGVALPRPPPESSSSPPPAKAASKPASKPAGKPPSTNEIRDPFK